MQLEVQFSFSKKRILDFVEFPYIYCKEPSLSDKKYFYPLNVKV